MGAGQIGVSSVPFSGKMMSKTLQTPSFTWISAARSGESAGQFSGPSDCGSVPEKSSEMRPADLIILRAILCSFTSQPTSCST